MANDQYSDDEATRRMNEALRRALNTPPQPQATVRHPRKKAEKVGDHRRPQKRDADAGA